jgi:hypothetical protein
MVFLRFMGEDFFQDIVQLPIQQIEMMATFGKCQSTGSSPVPIPLVKLCLTMVVRDTDRPASIAHGLHDSFCLTSVDYDRIGFGHHLPESIGRTIGDRNVLTAVDCVDTLLISIKNSDEPAV